MQNRTSLLRIRSNINRASISWLKPVSMSVRKSLRKQSRVNIATKIFSKQIRPKSKKMKHKVDTKGILWNKRLE